jgi:plasmid stabilization system protein ParE
MMEVIWLDETLQDLKEIGRYIAEDDSAAAYRVLTKIDA